MGDILMNLQKPIFENKQYGPGGGIPLHGVIYN